MSPKNTKRLLSPDGKIRESTNDIPDNSCVILDSDFSPLDVDDVNLSVDCIAVNFLSTADGRGFSIPSILRNRFQFQGTIRVSGGINPDQLILAFQSGFDGVWVSDADWYRYTADAWLEALTPVVSFSYSGTRSIGVKSIWELRKSGSTVSF